MKNGERGTHAAMMQMDNRVLGPADKQILESYKGLLAGLADYLGDGFEIVLHSLEDLDRSVIAIINGHYTGRQVGAPVTDLALAMLNEIERNGQTNYVSYFNHNKKAEPLKSSTIAIQGEGGRVIGLLCINFYLHTPFYRFLQQWTPVADDAAKNAKQTVETYSDSTEELITDALQQIYPDVMGDHNVPTVNKNKEIIARLDEKGLFNLKNAVPLTAEHLGISKNTVYMHVRNLHK